MRDAIVIGGGLSGMAAATALASQGLSVTLFEPKPFLGGRATSYTVPIKGGDPEEVDNCQHILLKCCVNLRDFYRRVGMESAIEFHREFYFMEPGGRISHLRRGVLPAPLHFAESFLRATYLSLGDKLALGRAMLALRWERTRRKDLDQITMMDWLREKGQTPRLIERFWRQVLVSAINVELDQMAAAHGFQVMWLGFLAASDTYEMGIPKVPMAHLYEAVRGQVAEVRHEAVEAFDAERGVLAEGQWHEARAYVSAVPADKLAKLVPQLPVQFDAFQPSSITGIHLWFEQSVTGMPHGTLLDRQMQWFYSKDGGRYLVLVVSASDRLLKMTREEILEMAIAELGEFLPKVRTTTLSKFQIIKEARATFRAVPGLEALRPVSRTAIPNLFLAGDWTRTGWPSTMEGAVRGGYLAAEAASEFLGRPGRFLLPDVA